MKRPTIKDILSGLIIYNQPIRLLSSVAIYYFIVWPMADILCPSLFFIAISSLKLHHTFSVDLLDVLIKNTSRLILLVGTLIAQARCFNAKGLRTIFSRDKDDTGHEVIRVPPKGVYMKISCVLYLTFFLILMSESSPTYYLVTPFDFSHSLYLDLESMHYISFLKRYCVYFGSSIEIFNRMRFAGGMIYFLIFCFGYHYFVPNAYLVGTQFYIWKIRSEYV